MTLGVKQELFHAETKKIFRQPLNNCRGSNIFMTYQRRHLNCIMRKSQNYILYLKLLNLYFSSTISP